MKIKTLKGYTRKKIRKTFKYFDSANNEITDIKILERIKQLVIPPNWRNVWIAKSPRNELQAYGFDQKDRKQYIYHSKFVNERQAQKFKNALYTGQYLQDLRKITSRHLKHPDWNMEKLCAIAFKIMDTTLIRIGNRRYTVANKSYGLSTLEKRHVKIDNNTITLAYKGKKGVFQEKTWKNKQQAMLLGELLRHKGKTLFQVDNASCNGLFCGRTLNAYLRDNCAGEISCKDIRIWGASREAFSLLTKSKQPEGINARKRQLNAVIKEVAKRLGNTKTVSQNYYIHPIIQQVYLDGKFPLLVQEKLSLDKLEYKLFRFLLKYS